MIERTFILIKPDAVQRALIGDIVSRFEQKGLKLVGLKMIQLADEILRKHYGHIADQPFFPELSKFMIATPVVAMVFEGPRAIEIARLTGGINTQDIGTVRGDYSISRQRNLIHTSDSVNAAVEEIERFFSPSELFQYEMPLWEFMFSTKDFD